MAECFNKGFWLCRVNLPQIFFLLRIDPPNVRILVKKLLKELGKKFQHTTSLKSYTWDCHWWWFFLLGHTGGYWRSDKLSFINAVEPREFKIVGEIQNLCLIFEIVLFEKRKELNGVISEIWWYILLAFFTHRTFWDLWNVYIWSYFSLCLVTKCYCHTCQVLKI